MTFYITDSQPFIKYKRLSAFFYINTINKLKKADFIN